MILDVFSRCVVGWMVMERESALLAEEFIAETWGDNIFIPEIPAKDRQAIHAIATV